MSASLAEQAERLNRACRHGAGGPAAVLLTDAARLGEPDRALAHLPPGSLVIQRDYGHPDRLAWARRLQALCRQQGHYFLLAGDWRLAMRLKCDGVHLPEAQLARAPVKRIKACGLMVTASGHGRAALWRAERSGVDAVLLSPVFSTASHPDARPLGVHRFAGLVRHSALPVYALGGVNEGTARRLKGTGAAGIAAISGFA